MLRRDARSTAGAPRLRAFGWRGRRDSGSWCGQQKLETSEQLGVTVLLLGPLAQEVNDMLCIVLQRAARHAHERTDHGLGCFPFHRFDHLLRAVVRGFVDLVSSAPIFEAHTPSCESRKQSKALCVQRVLATYGWEGDDLVVGKHHAKFCSAALVLEYFLPDRRESYDKQVERVRSTERLVTQDRAGESHARGLEKQWQHAEVGASLRQHPVLVAAGPDGRPTNAID
eukprot:3316669-Prymnesium_polylepis.1